MDGTCRAALATLPRRQGPEDPAPRLGQGPRARVRCGCSPLHASCLGVRRPEPSPAPLRTRETRMIRVLYLLFVLSGAAGLIYESIWTRYLGLFVGHDAYAQIVVLVIFLGGMSPGAMVVSRWGHRVRKPLIGLRAGGVRRRLHRAGVSRPLRVDHRARPTVHLPGAGRLGRAPARQVDPRRAP